jgi:FkbM family methyltransferase
LPTILEKVKNGIKYFLQRMLGFKQYLVVFSRFKISTLQRDSMECDFFTFMGLLNQPKTILDIGANIGIMTVHLSKRFPQAHIHAIEPIPDNLYVLQRNVAHYKLTNVTVHGLAVGNQEGCIKMVLPVQGKTKMQGLSHVKHDTITEWNEGDEFEVECTTLDSLFPDEQVDAIKLDIENFEFFALKGATKILERSKPIIYAELWDNENRTNCFNLLTAMGYTINVVDNKVLVPFDPVNHNQQNFIFLIGEDAR